MVQILELKKRLFEKRGIDIISCTPDEWLALAIEAEANARRCGVGDPAFAYMMEQASLYEKAAILSESILHANKQKDIT